MSSSLLSSNKTLKEYLICGYLRENYSNFKNYCIPSIYFIFERFINNSLIKDRFENKQKTFSKHCFIDIIGEKIIEFRRQTMGLCHQSVEIRCKRELTNNFEWNFRIFHGNLGSIEIGLINLNTSNKIFFYLSLLKISSTCTSLSSNCVIFAPLSDKILNLKMILDKKNNKVIFEYYDYYKDENLIKKNQNNNDKIQKEMWSFNLPNKKKNKFKYQAYVTGGWFMEPIMVELL